MSKLIAVVMAAGHGTRMKSDLPKVIHPAAGRPLVYFPVRAALDLGADQVVVVTNPQTKDAIEEELARHVSTDKFSIAIQEVPQGTGDAARSGVRAIKTEDNDRILILSGDVPLLQAEDLRPLQAELEAGKRLSFLTFLAEDPHGYGRILRDPEGVPTEIREQKDLRNDTERAIREVNAGVYLAQAGPLRDALEGLQNNNAQGEYYLTDILPPLAEGGPTSTVVADESSLAGVNDRAQLSEIEQILFTRIRQNWAKSGVSFVGTPLIDDTAVLAQDVRIEDGVRIRGKSKVGARTFVDVGNVIVDSEVGEDATIKPYSMMTESVVGNGAQIGPFAHLRPKSRLEDEVHMGNYVETKNTVIKRGAKANHLAYLGDAEIGEKSNLGAGTIICNYDGFRKQKTVVGKGVFVGSDSQLVAPVNIGDDSYVATATTVTKDVPSGALAIGRVRQDNKEGYAAPLRARLKAAKDAELAKKKG